jgi:hypothetical protein
VVILDVDVVDLVVDVVVVDAVLRPRTSGFL